MCGVDVRWGAGGSAAQRRQGSAGRAAGWCFTLFRTKWKRECTCESRWTRRGRPRSHSTRACSRICPLHLNNPGGIGRSQQACKNLHRRRRPTVRSSWRLEKCGYRSDMSRRCHSIYFEPRASCRQYTQPLSGPESGSGSGQASEV